MGISEHIEDGVNGFLIDSQSSDKIIEVLKNLDSNFNNKSIAMAARETIEQYLYNDFVSIYMSNYIQTL